MQFYALPEKATSVHQVGPIRRFLACAAAVFLLASTNFALAQSTVPDGEYAGVFKGKVHYTDRQPAEQQIVEQATIRISTNGDNVTIDVGQIGSAMSATRFQGTRGNAKFVAIHSVPGRENQAKLLWGNVQNGNTLRGTLLYPRVADGLVPGYTELVFEARSGASSSASTNNPAPRDRMPASSSTPGSSSSPGLSTRFPRTTLPSSSSSSSSTKPKKELKPKQPTVASGTSVIGGTITGDTGVVINVQLVDESENTVQSTTLDQNGRYRFRNIGAGRYWIYVNDGRAEAYITTNSDDRSIDADGRSSYNLNFNVNAR